jgi:hypothetical protein
MGTDGRPIATAVLTCSLIREIRVIRGFPAERRRNRETREKRFQVPGSPSSAPKLRRAGWFNDYVRFLLPDS